MARVLPHDTLPTLHDTSQPSSCTTAVMLHIQYRLLHITLHAGPLRGARGGVPAHAHPSSPGSGSGAVCKPRIYPHTPIPHSLAQNLHGNALPIHTNGLPSP